MKKKVLLGVLSVLALVACTGNETSETSSSSSESSNSVEEESSSVESVFVDDGPGWTDEQKKIMTEHLHGLVVPSIDIGDATVEYSEEDEEVIIKGTKVIDQKAMSVYTTRCGKLGWYDVTDQYKDVQGFPGYGHMYEKGATIESYTVYVDILFYLVNDSGNPSQSGKFVLEAYVESSYMSSSEFPSEFFNELTTQVGSNVQVPAFKADSYEIDLEHLIVYCYVDDDKACSTYFATLKQAGFTGFAIDDYYSATSPDGKYKLWGIYEKADEQYDACLDIMFSLPDEA